MYNNALLKEDKYMFEDVSTQLSIVKDIEPYSIKIISMILLDKEQFCCDAATD